MSRSSHRVQTHLRNVLLSASPGVVSGPGVVRLSEEGLLVHERLGAPEPEPSPAPGPVERRVLTRLEGCLERAMRRGVLSPAALLRAIDELSVDT